MPELNETSELSETPELTVGLVIGAERERAGRSLEHLLRQTALDRIEIVCVDLAPDAPPPEEVRADAVRYVPAGQCAFMEEGMALCIEVARAPLVAFIEDHSHAAPGWAAEVIRTFDRPEVAMVNYSFTYAGSGTYLDRAFLVTEYGRWMAPTRPGAVSIAACNNIAYRLAALAPYRGDLAGWLGMAPALHRRIQQAGGTVWQAPGALVAHESWDRLRDGCWANGVMKRMYGGYRPAREGWGTLRRVWYALAMVAAPPLHLGRLAWSLRNRPRLWWAFFTALPVSTTVYVYASYQEALGYLFGPGNSRELFTEMELAVSRRA
jgi:GT2 family glycosyltransferase